ncbi:uncharacterized protein [Rutidosis leptorrhynchoides]|uniref:uncharacterized protein n=1 Tax=Rutidosis leptorrhynchoides TaxID=125765 RepID=UPI003A99E681
MHIDGKSMEISTTPTAVVNMIYMLTILGRDGAIPRILCDKSFFSLPSQWTNLPIEDQAVRGIRRKVDSDSDSCVFKPRSDSQIQPSPIERSFAAVSPILGQVGDSMEI